MTLEDDLEKQFGSILIDPFTIKKERKEKR